MHANATDPGPAPQRPSLGAFVARAVAFVAVFMLLQAGWEAARGTWLEKLWVQELTVRSATGLINTLTPAVGAVAQGARIVAPGGGLNVLFGCEGTDVVFLLVSAFTVFALPWRLRLLGVASGLVLVFVLNQARIVGLFYAFRQDRALFELMHAAGAPLLMVALCGLFFHAWLQLAQTQPPARTVQS
jgi:exosortase/archaeosortase family protein